MKKEIANMIVGRLKELGHANPSITVSDSGSVYVRLSKKSDREVRIANHPQWTYAGFRERRTIRTDRMKNGVENFDSDRWAKWLMKQEVKT